MGHLRLSGFVCLFMLRVSGFKKMSQQFRAYTILVECLWLVPGTPQLPVIPTPGGFEASSGTSPYVHIPAHSRLIHIIKNDFKTIGLLIDKKCMFSCPTWHFEVRTFWDTGFEWLLFSP